MSDKKTCFIIMPLSVPEHFLAKYEEDKNHFKDVLSEIFIPAIELAGLEAIPPLSKGEVVIHKGIIQNLISADLVLCDISTLNANVYLELGIRTALNKPVCLVKDEFVDQIPFDVGPVNHHTYKSKLLSKFVKEEVPNISKHISDSLNSSKGINSLWTVFGVMTQGTAPTGTDDLSLKISYLFDVIDNINHRTVKIQNITEKIAMKHKFQNNFDLLESKVGLNSASPEILNMEKDLLKTISNFKLTVTSISYNYDQRIVTFKFSEKVTNEAKFILRQIALTYGYEIQAYAQDGLIIFPAK